MDLLFAPETQPFAVAAAILVALVGLEIATLLAGFSLSHVVEKSFGLDDHGEGGGGLNWLNVGGVPLLILLMIALGAFAATGFVIQEIAAAVARPLSPLVAALGAVVVTIPAVRSGSRLVARLVPRDETYAVELSDFVGRTAEVSVGPLDQGLPGAVRLKDAHGNWHALRARAAPDAAAMPTGATVLLVDHSASVFLAIPAPDDLEVVRPLGA